ncbi:MAG: hypothetical protein ACXVYL_04200 [Oryzihumus sp.]
MGTVRPHQRRWTLLTGWLAVLLGLGLVTAAPAIAAPDKSGVKAVTEETAALAPGQSGWLSVVWTGDLTVKGWSTTVDAPKGITVTYPTTRGGSDTSLYGSSSLVGGTKDFTAFKVSVPYDQKNDFQVTLTSTYVLADDTKGTLLKTTARVKVPVEDASGPAFTQKTTSVSIAAGSNTFQQIAFTGGQTDLTGFTVSLGTLPAGLEVAYPGDKSSSGLNGGSTLVGGSTDYAAVRFIATGLKAGTYTIPLTISYTAASAQTAIGKVTLVVS